MTTTDRTRKILWSLAGNRCAICHSELVRVEGSAGIHSVVGEEAHIVPSSADGPRGSRRGSSPDDSYANLVLLCQNDHHRVDEHPDLWPVEKLLAIKAEHEEWVASRLGVEGVGARLRSPFVEPLPLARPPIGVPIPPARLVERPGEYTRIRAGLLSANPKSGPRTVAAFGMAGAGKTVIASLIGHDPEIEKAYPDGTVWLSVGQHPDLPSLQTTLARLYGQANAAYADIAEGSAQLRALLADRAVLLIFDDVWEKRELDALMCFGKRSACLFTTRDEDLARSLGGNDSCVEVPNLEARQARELLAAWASTARNPLTIEQLPRTAEAICAETGNVALAIALCGGMIRSEGSTTESWDNVLNALRRADIQAIQLRWPPDAYHHSNLFSAIESSVNALSEEGQWRFSQLGVFAGRGFVPPSAIQTLWGTTPYQTPRMVSELVGRSLVQRGEDGRIVLHDLLSDFARSLLAASPGGIEAANLRLVEGYRGRCSSSVWPGGPNDGYFFENLAYHLAQAGLSDELGHLLLDFDWLTARLRSSDVVGLLSDFAHAPRPPSVEAIRSALRLSAPFLATDPARLSQQLMGRLVGSSHTDILHLQEGILARTPKPWLCPLTAALSPVTGPLEQVVESHQGEVEAIALSPDGSRIVSSGGYRDYPGHYPARGTVRIWSLESGALEQVLKVGANGVHALVVTPDGKYVVEGGGHGSYAANEGAIVKDTLRIWDLESGRLERNLEGHRRWWVDALALTPDGKKVVSGGDAVRVWDLATGSMERALVGDWGIRVNALAVTPDGKKVLSSGDAVRVWDLTTGCMERALPGLARLEWVHSVAVTPDGTKVVSGGRSVRVWDLTTQDEVRVFEGPPGSGGPVAVTPDGGHVASGGNDGCVRIWDLSSGRLEHTLEGHVSRVSALAITADGNHIVSGDNDGFIRVWSTSNSLHRLREVPAAKAYAVAVTPDGKSAVSGDDDGSVRIWELASGGLVGTLKGAARLVTAVAVTPDGKRVVAGGRGVVQVWNLATGQLERTWKGGPHAAHAVAVTADGEHLVWGGEGNLVVSGLTNGAQERTMEARSAAIYTLAVTPDGKRVVSGGIDGNVRVWDLLCGSQERILEGQPHAVQMVVVTPDGKHVVSAGGDSAIRVWDLGSGDLERTVRVHTGKVSAIAVMADGKKVASGDIDGFLRVWDLLSGEEIASWRTDHGISVLACSGVSVDSSRLVYADSAGGVHVLRLLGSAA